jgi:PAS domain S-box-containing protein
MASASATDGDASDARVRADADTPAADLEREVLRSEERFRLLVEAVKDYAIFMLDRHGYIQTWNPGVRRLKGYEAEDIIGKHFSVFYTPEDLAVDKPARVLAQAASEGSYEEEGLRLRKDGTRFWANVLITSIVDRGQVIGFAKVTRDLTERRAAQAALEDAAKELETRVAERTAQLAESNEELAAFGYSVSHDLRAPLRAMDGFSKRVLASAAERLTENEREQLERVRAAAQRMSHLIDDMLRLSRLSRVDLVRREVDLAATAKDIVDELRRAEPERSVDVVIEQPMVANADVRLVRTMLENLLGNAWKFTRKQAHARIELGCSREPQRVVYHVRDNGAGFDPRYAAKLFLPFQRLHSARDYEGTGIGLATVHRIVRRHGGEIWATSQPGDGATFSFTLAGAR